MCFEIVGERAELKPALLKRDVNVHLGVAARPCQQAVPAPVGFAVDQAGCIAVSRAMSVLVLGCAEL